MAVTAITFEVVVVKVVMAIKFKVVVVAAVRKVVTAIIF